MNRNRFRRAISRPAFTVDTLAPIGADQRRLAPSGSFATFQKPSVTDAFRLTLTGSRNNHHGLCPAELQQRDGHSFGYILHYMATGDLVYPMHEGFHRVDALLQVSIPPALNRR